MNKKWHNITLQVITKNLVLCLKKKNQCAIVVSFPHSTAINYILVPDFYVHNCKRENKALEDKIATY